MSDAISPQFRSAGGLRVRYAESGPVDGSTILLLNPWPESCSRARPSRASASGAGEG